MSSSLSVSHIPAHVNTGRYGNVMQVFMLEFPLLSVFASMTCRHREVHNYTEEEAC